MTSIHTAIADIRALLVDTFSAIDTWFDKEPGVRSYRPQDGGWTVDEILEHIGLTNHFLLILIEKGTGKALQNVQGLDLQAELHNYQFSYDKLAEIGRPDSFAWTRPDHMEPKGAKAPAEVREQLKEQVSRCLHQLELLKNGEGVLYRTTMSVNSLGKIDVYEYVCFLAQHGQRHLTQMQRNEAELRAENGQIHTFD